MNRTFTVMPMNQYLTLEAGRVYEGEITVANPADAERDFYYAVSVAPYSVVDAYNTADLATVSNWSEMVNWVEIENPTGVIKANQTAKIHYRIQVPLDAPAGGQYAAIAVRSNEPATAGSEMGVQNVLELASVIYAEIAGETNHAGWIAENTIPGFVASGTPMVNTLLINNGNVHEMATVTIRVRNLLTGQTVFPHEGESDEFHELVMPAASRYVTRELDELPALGIYEVTQNVAYLGETSYNTVVMVICPIWFIVLMMLTVGAAIGTIAALIWRRRQKKSCQMSDAAL